MVLYLYLQHDICVKLAFIGIHTSPFGSDMSTIILKNKILSNCTIPRNAYIPRSVGSSFIILLLCDDKRTFCNRLRTQRMSTRTRKRTKRLMDTYLRGFLVLLLPHSLYLINVENKTRATLRPRIRFVTTVDRARTGVGRYLYYIWNNTELVPGSNKV